MVKKVMYQRIQQLKRQGANKSQISRELGIDRKTVFKYFNMSEKSYRDYLQRQAYRYKRLDSFKEEIIDVYRTNNFVKLNMAAVYDYLEEKFKKLPCTEKTLRNYIAFLIETGELVLEIKIRVYREVSQLPYGRQMQLDFGVHKGANGKSIYIFASLLSASRFKYVAFQDEPFTAQSTIRHILDAFDYFGGRPEELAIDQDRVMVVSENHGDILYTKDFTYFIDEMELNMYVCRAADPESKGKVENLVKYVKYNFFDVRDFDDVESAKESLTLWLNRRANGKISQATKRIPADDILEERKALRPLKNSIFRKDLLSEREERLVSDECLISYRGSRYSVPTIYRNRKVEVYEANDKLFIFDILRGSLIAEHSIALIPGSRVTDNEHFRKKELKAKELKKGVREMFEFSEWQDFAEKNFRAFRRYVRDQCLEANKYFSKEIETAVLRKALALCLEHETYSFANLNDTYNYILNEEKVNKLPQKVLNGVKGVKRDNIKVKGRSISDYQNILEKGGVK